MEKEIIITEFSNANKSGVTLHLNKKAALKTGNIKADRFWISWDKIGAALFDDYTKRTNVADLDNLRNDK